MIIIGNGNTNYICMHTQMVLGSRTEPIARHVHSGKAGSSRGQGEDRQGLGCTCLDL